MFIHPSREIRYDCSKPKGKIHEPKYLHIRFCQSDNNSRVPTCLRVQYTFSASVPVSTATFVPNFTNKLQQSKQRKSYLTCLWQYTTVQVPVKTWKQTHSKVSCFVSSSVQNSFHFLHNSGRFHWLTVLHAQRKHFHNCSSNRHPWLPDASEKSKPMFPNRQTKFTLTMLTHSPLSTNNLNTKFHCAFSAMTVPISLSLSQHSSTYTARQIIMLQASISRSPVSANIRQAPLFLHTTEPQVLNYSRLITKNVWQLNQGHWQSKFDPPGSHANISQMWQLNQGHRPSRFSCQRSSYVATKPRSLTLQVLMPTFLICGN